MGVLLSVFDREDAVVQVDLRSGSLTLDAIAIFRQALRWGCRDMPSVVCGNIVAGRSPKFSASLEPGGPPSRRSRMVIQPRAPSG
ncbi:hypothetical protein, partial [Streptomyces shenzhenensis]